VQQNESKSKTTTAQHLNHGPKCPTGCSNPRSGDPNLYMQVSSPQSAWCLSLARTAAYTVSPYSSTVCKI